MKRNPPVEMPSWRIFRPRGMYRVYVGIVKAPTASSAIAKAIKKFNIADPEHQKELVAEQRDE